MTEYKRQHFVPQWYQRNISPDGEQIWIYDINLKQHQKKTISETLQEDFFYGTDFEKSLQPIEEASARVISTIIKNEKVKGISPQSRHDLLQFVLLQSTRTQSEKIITENSVKQNFERQIKPRYKKKYEGSPEHFAFIETLDLSDINFFIINIRIALAIVQEISDLTVYLLINNTNTPFITSDHPVVLNNYYYTKRPSPGFLSPGLQIFVPISEKLCILLIHSELYQIKSNYQQNIIISDDSDVDHLNKLQILSGYQQVLSKEEKFEYIRRLHEEVAQLRGTRSAENMINDENYGFHFSFLKYSRSASKQIPRYAAMARVAKKAGIARSGNPYRDEKLLKDAWAATERVVTDVLEEIRQSGSMSP